MQTFQLGSITVTGFLMLNLICFFFFFCPLIVSKYLSQPHMYATLSFSFFLCHSYVTVSLLNTTSLSAGRQILDESPNMSAPSSPHPCAHAPPSPTLSLKGQKREWNLSVPTLPTSLTWDKVTFTEGQFISLGTLALFGERPLKGVVEWQGVVVKKSCWKGWKVEKWGLRNVTTAAMCKDKKGRGEYERVEKRFKGTLQSKREMLSYSFQSYV